MKKSLVGAAALGLFTIVLFQNCGQGFKFNNVQMSTDNASHSVPHIVPSSAKVEAAADITFTINNDSEVAPSAQFTWTHTFNNTAKGCTEKNGATGRTYVINCAAGGSLKVDLTVVDSGSSIELGSYSATLTTPPVSGPEIPLMVTFEIPAGTGSQAWNSAAQIVETFVGQTLQIRNMDSITHQLHTNGRPCPHGNPIASGATGNCVITQAYDSATNGAVYDHIVGTSAPFALVTHNGQTLYQQRCQSCHGPMASTTVNGVKVSEIKAAFQSQPQMIGNPNLVNLTQRQIEAISYALGGR